MDVVDTAKIYDLEGTRTNKGFKLKLGKEERIYRLAFLSNSKFTESEVNYWLDAMRSNVSKSHFLRMDFGTFS